MTFEHTQSNIMDSLAFQHNYFKHRLSRENRGFLF